MGRRAKAKTEDFDRELSDLPAPLRRREMMMRVEAVIFAASKPVPRETLAPLVGSDCNLDQLIDDIRDELRSRPYELIEVAGGYQHRTRPLYGAVIRASGAVAAPAYKLSPLEQLVLTAVAYGKPVGRDAIAALRGAGLVATGPRSPQPGAPYTYVTTPAFLSLAGLPSLRDLPDLDRLEAAGLLGMVPLPEELRSALGITDDAEALAEVATDEDDMIGAAFEE